MPINVRSLTFGFTLVLLNPLAAGGGSTADNPGAAAAQSKQNESGILWREPADIGSRDLYYGSGGEKHQPQGPYRFVEEDLNGTSPKYVVRDRDDVKWTIKLGAEARPETAASRLVWAVGYFTNEDYYLEDLKVEGMPDRPKRGKELLGPDGSMHGARLKRHLGDEKKIDNWQWRDTPFANTQELNGLKVMMALINNWDLKDVNNKLYAGKSGEDSFYIVSDLGASLGTNGLSYPPNHSKGDLDSYIHSKFIGRISHGYVDFSTPSRPSLIYASWPPAFLKRVRLDGLVHHIPLEDARWIGHLLSCLSGEQIRDGFRAAGYNQEQIDAFSKVVQDRIGELNSL